VQPNFEGIGLFQFRSLQIVQRDVDARPFSSAIIGILMRPSMLSLLLSISLLQAGMSTAHACEEALKLREVLPLDGTEGVPINSRVVVAFIGMGTSEDFDIKVFNGASQRNIGVDREDWCYTHEGPNELHCWTRLTPRQELEPWTTYEIRVQLISEDTGAEPEPEQVSSFITDEWEADTSVAALGFRVTDAWEMDPSELDSCDWNEVSRWWLEIDPVVDDSSGLELFHIWELDEDGHATGEDPIHTVFSPRNIQLQQIKQYLDGSVSHSDCFGALREGPTGARGPFTTHCFEGEKKPRQDTGESLPDDTDGTAGSAGDAAQDTSSESEEPLYPLPSCGCSSLRIEDSHWLLGFSYVFLLMRRREN
jgi:hypothetical protein